MFKKINLIDIDIENSIIPYYKEYPYEEINFEDFLDYSLLRFKFHKLLNFEEKNNILEYNDIKTLSNDYKVPIKLLENNEENIKDQISFWSLFFIILKQPQFKTFFIEAESLLIFNRLKYSSIKLESLNDNFFPNIEIKKKIISSKNFNNGKEFYEIEKKDFLSEIFEINTEKKNFRKS